MRGMAPTPCAFVLATLALVSACADGTGGVTVTPRRGDAATGDMGPGSLLADGSARDAGAVDAATADANEGLTDFRIVERDLPPIAPFTECTIVLASSISTTGGHVAACSPLSHDTNPPTHGEHYAVLPQMREYDSPVPWGFLLEALDQGAIVMLHNCASGCPDVLERFHIVQDQIPDSTCDAGATAPRVIIAPDPSLDVPFALVAWGHVYKATCLDAPGVTTFVGGHYGDRGPAVLCEAGVDPRAFCEDGP